MSAFIDARTVPSGTVLETDLAIVGGGPAGISMALALANTPLRVVLLESGGMTFDAKTQALYAGAEVGAPYLPLDTTRMRYLGGSTNHWGGWCRPMDDIDFEERTWMPYSGWPFGRKALEPYYARAQALCEAGPFIYDKAFKWSSDQGPTIALGDGGVITRWFQFSKMRGSVLPTHFGDRYAEDLRRVPRLSTYLHANVTRLGLDGGGAKINQLDVQTLNGKRFTLKPKYTVLAMGAVEIARLMLASNDVNPAGVGNENDLVGRFFADHPIPRDTATLVLFDGKLAPFYQNNQIIHGAIMRAGLFPSEDFRRKNAVMDSSTTIENKTELDDLGKAAVAAAAAALGVDASNATAYSLGCGMEITPDPNRRFTLDTGRDALGLPRLKLHMRLADTDFARFRQTLKELGRQLLEARTGMLRLNLKTRGQWLDGLDWGNHHMGTTRMHVDPRKGVVDANLQVHGISNLFVAGSAVYPTYSAANPTVNLLALALRLVDHLKGLPR
ncbi:MAG: GMC family oxidoreductase [Alphaproteobacteria bacterium]|nr:GMC family oxidoreductase [Alphaproteobacteria bacterium]MDE2162221.1 GMC family oxidoreductase [Alphaproteobacteria bacterium]MDE2499580.1 GMC family oxidoreductase [Alphaproteobacteria bacterium]